MKRWNRIKKTAIILFAVLLAVGNVEVETKASQLTAATDLTDDVKSADNTADDSGNKDDTGTSGEFMIDCDHLYDGMDKTYADGYVPGISNGCAYLVLPLLCSVPVKDQNVRVSLALGDSSDIPFVYKNYEKNVGISGACYPITFPLELKSDRVNGSYPVTVTVKGTGENGGMLEGQFVVYVTITDGKDPNATEPEPEKEPVFQPKLVVENYSCGTDEIKEGDSFDLSVTLKNTSTANGIKNLTILAAAPQDYFELVSASDSLYIGSVGAQENCAAAYTYRVKKGTPQGQYDITLSMDYADGEGNTYTSEGHARVTVSQEMKVQFDKLSIDKELRVADVVNASIQAMNLGRSKVYNVRAVIESDGLHPAGTIFIGDMEAGSTQTAQTEVTVIGLTEGESSYGNTVGKVICYYEDEAGNEYSEEQTLEITVSSPFSEQTDNEKDNPEQWWWIMAVVGTILFFLLAAIAIQAVRRRKKLESASLITMNDTEEIG